MTAQAVFSDPIPATAHAKPCATPGCHGMTEVVELFPAEYDDEGQLVKAAVMRSYSNYCEPCVLRIQREEATKSAANEQRQRASARAEWWTRIWKPDSIYHQTKRAQLPDQAASDKVLRWRPSLDKGVLLTGFTGSGKTRTVYLLLQHLLMTEGMYPKIKMCSKLRQEIVKAAMDSPQARAALMRELIQAPLLYLDDLGQMSSTDAAEEALMEIVEGRVNERRPIIATTQYSGDELAAKFRNVKTGEAIARRLGEFCYRVGFKSAGHNINDEEIPMP